MRLKQWIVALTLLFFIFNAYSQIKKLDVYTLSSATGIDPGKIHLQWASTNPTVFFEVQRSYNGSDFITIAKVQPGITAYSDIGLHYQKQYWYRLIAHNTVEDSEQTSNISNAITKDAIPNPYPIFQDTFDAKQINSKWSFVGGQWVQKNGMLQQSNGGVVGDIKKAILNDQKYPIDQTITAKIMVTSWTFGGGAHAGVGIFTDPITGSGYELVFSNQDEIGFVNDNIAWGAKYTYPWILNKWYWIKLTRQADTLLGKIWEDGMAESPDWMFTQSGWSDRNTGNPALSGGGLGDGFATAVFDAAVVTGTKTRVEPFSFGGDPLVKQDDYKITTFASGLNYPKSMQQLADDSLLVATSNPNGTSGNFLNSTGTILRFVDENEDGVADGPGQQLYTGLPGALTSLRSLNRFLVVTSSQPKHESIWLFQFDNHLINLRSLGSLNFTFPDGWNHTTSALAIRTVPGSYPVQYEIFFNVGSQYNDKADDKPVAVSGLLNANLTGSSIYSFKVYENFTDFSLTDLKIIAKGLRNADGMTFDVTSGDLLFVERGIRLADYPGEPLSPDALYKIPGGSIGNTVLDFGFPNSYITYRTNVQVGASLQNPAIAIFQPLPDMKVGEESEGASELAITPALFPFGLNNGILITFFGRHELGGLANEYNPLILYSKFTNKYFPFISSAEPKIGHISGILSTENLLFLADISSNGDLTTSAGTGQGIIYQISTLKSEDPLIGVWKGTARFWYSDTFKYHCTANADLTFTFDFNQSTQKIPKTYSVAIAVDNWVSSGNYPCAFFPDNVANTLSMTWDSVSNPPITINSMGYEFTGALNLQSGILTFSGYQNHIPKQWPGPMLIYLDEDLHLTKVSTTNKLIKKSKLSRSVRN